MNDQGATVNTSLWTHLRISRPSLLIFIAFCCCSAVARGSDIPKERWEYRFYLPVATVCDNSKNSLVDGLNKLGAEGWEVISFTPAGGESRATMVGRDQNNSQAALGQSVKQYATIQSRVTGCPLLLKRRLTDDTKKPDQH